jgi:hypothetical protein
MRGIWRFGADRQLSSRVSKQRSFFELETAVQIGCFVFLG